MPDLRKYGAETRVYFMLRGRGTPDFLSGVTIAAGDATISKDGGAYANVVGETDDDLFVDEGGGQYSLKVAIAEVQCASAAIKIVDQTSPKEWEDLALKIETYGNASAQHAMDFDDAVRGGMTALPDANADAAGGLIISDAGGLDADAVADSINNISNTGSAVNKVASSYTLTTGTQSANTYEDTFTINGVKHTHTDDTGTMTLVYHFLLGPGVPSLLTSIGALTGLNDDLIVNAYDWVTSSWQQIGTISGKANSDNETQQYTLFTSMVGTGSDFGKVDIQFTSTGLTTATLYVDQLFTSASQGSGDYNLGAIWINTNKSNTGTVPETDGITTNPVSTWAAAKTLSGKTNIDKFSVINGSTLTMDASCDNLTFIGTEYDLALDGQSFENAHIEEAHVSGIGTAGSGVIHFSKCFMGDVTLGKASLDQCGIEGNLTVSAAERYILSKCNAADASGVPPVIDFNGIAAAVGLRDWNGGIKVKNMAAGSSLSVQGRGKLTIDATCDAGGTIGIHGPMLRQDNVVGGFSGTINEDARVDLPAINAEVDTALSDWGKTGFSLIADQSAVTVGTVNLVTTCTTNTDMRGTDSASTHDVASIITALKASTGYTAGGAITFANLMKIVSAAVAGDVKDKSGGGLNIYDVDNGTTVILTADISETTPYVNYTVS